jgi:hypothetical protein
MCDLISRSIRTRPNVRRVSVRRNLLIIIVFLVTLIASLPQSGCLSLSGNLTASQTNLSFGNVAIGSSSNQPLTFRNSGAAAFTITKAVASGGGFSVTGPPLPLTLGVGQTTTFMARFAPSDIGSASGSLLITSTQETTPQLTSGSGSATPSIATEQKTIAMAGTGVSAAPSITTQPASQTVTAGQTGTFSVTSSGAAPLSYQWSKNGAAIPGATLTTYTTPATATSDTGSRFTVGVSNSAGNVTSTAATLTVTSAAGPPSITTQPASQTVVASQTATFRVTASGTAPLSYQWRKNGTAISGATSSGYTTPATTSADSGSQFTVAVSNSIGTVTSNAATLTVQAAGQLTASASNLNYGNITVGSSSLLSVTLTNKGTSSVAISNVTLSGAGLSIVGVSSGLILAAGNSAVLNVTFAPSSSGTLNGSVTIGSNATNPTVTISLSGIAVQQASHSVTLLLAANSSNVAGLNVLRSSVSGGPYTKLNFPIITSMTYTDSTVVANQTYFYVATSVDSAGNETGYSNEVSATIPTP